jgi:hypothetical protein
MSFVALVVWLALWLKPDGNRTIGRVGWAAIAFWCVCLLSLSLSVMLPLEPVERSQGDGFLLILAGLCGVTLLVRHAVADLESLRRLLALFVLGASVMSGLALFHASTGHDLVPSLRPPGFSVDRRVESKTLEREGMTRVRSTASHPIELSVLAAAAVPLALYFAFHGRRWRATATLGSALLAVGAVVSLSRSGILCLLLVMAMVVPTLSGNQRLRVGLGGLICVAGLVAVNPNLADSLATILGTASEQASTDMSVGARRDDYGPALELVRERPLLGRGYGTFNPDLNFFLDNQVLKILIEAGIVGLVAMLGLIVTAVSACLRFRQRSRSPGDRALAWAVFTSLTAITVSFVFYDALYFSMTASAYFFLLGVSGALERFTPAVLADGGMEAGGSPGSGAQLVGEP